jgi:hypothetical protein
MSAQRTHKVTLQDTVSKKLNKTRATLAEMQACLRAKERRRDELKARLVSSWARALLTTAIAGYPEST